MPSTFAALGERMQDHLDLRRIDPTYHLTFPDNSQLQLTSDMQQMRTRLEAIEPGSFERMLHYLGEAGRIYDLSHAQDAGAGFPQPARVHQPAHAAGCFCR